MNPNEYPDYWPHAPAHRLSTTGTYMVTAATYNHQHFFRPIRCLDYLQDRLLAAFAGYGWSVQAWAVFSNHYHVIAHCAQNPELLSPMLRKLHYETGVAINQWDGQPGRKVWHNFWDRRLTHHTSYMARLKYVHFNPAKHGLTDDARTYRWCSAQWLEDTHPRPLVASICRFKTDKVKEMDEYTPLEPL